MKKLNAMTTQQTHAVTPVKPKKTSAVAKLNDPMIGAAMVFQHIHDPKRNNIQLAEIIDEMQGQLELFKTQGVGPIEDLLIGQAMALQAIFVRSAARIGEADQLSTIQAWSSVALKAQNQCRQTLIALAEIKNPPQIAYIKQQNNAINQQVNNCPAQTSEKINRENELLEVPYVSVDNPATFTTISTDPAMETVGAVHWAKDGSRQG